MMRKSDFMKEWYYTTSDDIDKKYYFNELFKGIPASIQEELHMLTQYLKYYMYIDTELLKKMFRIIMYIAMTS